jgi:hypothetical protein
MGRLGKGRATALNRSARNENEHEQGALHGEGTVRHVQQITGRGFAVVLENDFSGRVASGQVLESPAGQAVIESVTFADERDKAGNRVTYSAAMIEDAAGRFFAKGQRVKFYFRLH